MNPILTAPSRTVDHIRYGFTDGFGRWMVVVIYDDATQRGIATGGPVMHSDTIKAVAQALVAEMGLDVPILLDTEDKE